MNERFKHKEQFVTEPIMQAKYPWESEAVRLNPEITKHFTISISLEYYSKLAYIQKFRDERSRTQVVREFLYKEIDREIERIKKAEYGVKSGIKG